ncbi:hypothetical protein ACVIGB_006609 [Bradyrhizobium sp. USDA 4341]
MAQEVVGSKFKADVGYGSAADTVNPSSLEPGQKVKRSAIGETLQTEVDPVPAPQTRSVSDAEYPPAHGMRSRSHEGGVIPANSRSVTKVAPRSKR